ncbi:MAG TPA: proline dehydrogenase family protein [Actinomycetota bacterium]|nr:proline dehydrogenase family protein [Actinomycetota bacterium]
MNAPVLRLTQARWFRWVATRTPPGRALASRFVAGERLDDAIVAARSLANDRIRAMLDHLGENVRAPEHASDAANAYVQALDRIREERDLDCMVSVKLSQLGLDFSAELCVSHMERVMAAASSAGSVVMIDMESSAYVDRTLAIFRDLRARHDRIGLCLQCSLRRTEADIRILPTGSIIRLVKGAYLEPPEIALSSRREVDAAFARCFVRLIERGHSVHVATHDPRLIEGTKRFVERRRVPWSRVEYQMLFGVRRDLQHRLARGGYPVRVYIPYGAEWYPYLTRRLAERPANMWFFLSNLVRRGR